MELSVKQILLWVEHYCRNQNATFHANAFSRSVILHQVDHIFWDRLCCSYRGYTVIVKTFTQAAGCCKGSKILLSWGCGTQKLIIPSRCTHMQHDRCHLCKSCKHWWVKPYLSTSGSLQSIWDGSDTLSKQAVQWHNEGMSNWAVLAESLYQCHATECTWTITMTDTGCIQHSVVTDYLLAPVQSSLCFTTGGICCAHKSSLGWPCCKSNLLPV